MTGSRYVTGLRAVEQLLDLPDAEIVALYAEYRSANPRVMRVIESARSRGVDIRPANRARLKQMSGEARHQGVVAEIRRSTLLDEAGLRNRVEASLTAESGEPLLLLLLDDVQDPHNLGACLRTADAAGVDAVAGPRRGAAGLGPTVSKVAAGAAENLPFAQVDRLSRVLEWLGEYGVLRVGTSDRAEASLYDADLTGPVALVMGGEHAGISRRLAERCDVLVSLPMHGSVTSLNVSVATGVCLYEILRQRKPGDG